MRPRVAALSLAAALGTGPAPAGAGPVPDSLRVHREGSTVQVRWQHGLPRYGVFAAGSPDGVAVVGNLLVDTEADAHDEPLTGLPSPLAFLIVEDAPDCGCDDGDPCNGLETCGRGGAGCLPGLPPDCDDGVDCTLDACDPLIGCTHLPDPEPRLATPVQLAGNSLARYPWFEHVRAFNEDAGVELGVDATRFPALAGRTCDVYVLEHAAPAERCADPVLSDVRGDFDTRTFAAAGMRDDRFPLVAPFQLDALAGTAIGHGYDVVLDCDRDGLLGSGDFADGLGEEAGFYLVHDLTLPGPLPTAWFEQVGPLPPWPGPWAEEGDDLRVYYPAALDDPAFAGSFPLVVVSHGNGHSFAWYAYLQQHLASYGFIVMTHDNNTDPGIFTASLSTLRFTDKLIDEQATLGGGVLEGHLDTSRMTWIGHSRGGEGVVMAYRRLHDGDPEYVPAHFTAEDVALVSSIAPTEYWGRPLSNPYSVTYDLLFGAADGDVSGCAIRDDRDSFDIFERAAGQKSSHYVHGAGHSDFNQCGMGWRDERGPDLIGCEEAHRVQAAHYLALIEHVILGNRPAKDFLWRQYESLRPIGVAASTVVVNDYKDAPEAAAFVIDDFQSEPSADLSSSGGAVLSSVSLLEGLLEDEDTTFTDDPADLFNGMTRCNTEDAPNDDQRGVVIEHATGAEEFLLFELVPAGRDASAQAYLSFRACQVTRHAWTIAAVADQSFDVTLSDGAGRSSTINTTAFGGGVSEPYQRSGCGIGVGWQNEFELIRIRLADFLNEGSGLDLSDLRSVRFDFGPSHGSAEGKLGLDDLAFVPE